MLLKGFEIQSHQRTDHYLWPFKNGGLTYDAVGQIDPPSPGIGLTITRANKIGKSVSSFQVQNNVKHYLKKSGKEICMLCFALEVPFISFEHCVVWVHNQEKSDYYNETEM